jgi:hypothetical protein
MSSMSHVVLKQLIIRTRERYRAIDHADWDAENRRYRTPDQTKWQRAAAASSPPEWVEFVRILAQGWDYYGGSDLPGERRT